MEIEVQVTSSLLFLVLAILLGSLCRWVLTGIHGYKPPVSVIWFIIGIIIAILEISISHHKRYHGESILDENDNAAFAKFSFGIAQFARLQPQSAYYTLLPILLYDATQQQSWYYFKRVLSSGFILATAGILIQIAFLSVLIRYTFPGLETYPDQLIPTPSRSLFTLFTQHPISALPINSLQIERLRTLHIKNVPYGNLTNLTGISTEVITNLSQREANGAQSKLKSTQRQPNLPQHEPNLVQSEPNLSEDEPNLVQAEPNLAQVSTKERAWRFALLTATTVSSTDPIAVISVLEEMDAPHKFSALVDCEALINDGTALFVYSFLKELFESGTVSVGRAVWMFLRLSCLGPIVGFLWAAIVYRWLIRFQGHPLEQTLVVVCNGYAIYLITDVFLRSSGPLTIVVYGLYFSAFAKAALDTETRKVHKHFVTTLATGANMVIFVMSGCICCRMIWDGFTNQKNLVILDNDEEFDMTSLLKTPSTSTKVGFIFAFYVYVQLARLIMLLIVAPILNKLLSQYTWKEFILLFWSGLRGGVCLLTAMQVEHSGILGNDDLRQSATYSTSAALLILLFNATSFSAIYRKLQPFKPNSFRVAYLKRVMAMIEKEYDKKSEMLQDSWLFNSPSVLSLADKLIPKLDSVVIDKMGLAELRLIDVRKVFNQWTGHDLQGAWIDPEKIASSQMTGIHNPEEHSELDNGTTTWREQYMGVKFNSHRRPERSGVSLYLAKDGWGGLDNSAPTTHRSLDFDFPLDLEAADHMADRWPHELDDHGTKKEREKEMLLIMINAMRHMYQELYARSFISGTVMKDFSSIADIVSDFAMTTFRNTRGKGKWKKYMTAVKGSFDTSHVAASNEHDKKKESSCRESVLEPDWEVLIETISGFELEWRILKTFFRGRSRPGRVRRLFFCLTSDCTRNLDSPFAEWFHRLLNWLGPRQTFRALDELQMLAAYADVHEEILLRGGPQLDTMLGSSLTRSCKEVVLQAKRNASVIAKQFYKTFPYAIICHAAICLCNLKIKLLQTHLERGLLLNDDNDKMACVMKKQILRIRRFRPPYARH